MQAIILAGGMGTRLRAVTGDLPKPLAPVAGRPLLERQLEHLQRGGIQDVLLLTGYAGDQIQTFCGDGSRWGMALRCVRETTALGTAGAVLGAMEFLAEQFLVLYGDTVFDFDVQRMIAFHETHKADSTIFLHPNDHPFDSDLVEVDDADRVLSFHPYPHPAGSDLPNLVNAGIYILERSALAGLAESGELPAKPDFGKHVFSAMLRHGRQIAGYRSPEYVKDAGTPERLEKTGRDILSGRVAADSFRSPAPAVLLDRDGTLIEERGYVSKPENVVLLDGVGAALTRLNRSHYRTVMVTNQPVVARGEIDEAGLRRIHNRLETLLGAEHAYLDALYLCPHHPHGGYPGERVDLKIACECRKPGIGLLRRAESELNLKLSDSWMIGDTTIDMMTARRAGVRSILVGTGEGGRDHKWPCLPDFEVPTLTEAVSLILDRWPKLREKAETFVSSIEPGSVVLVAGLARSGKSTFAATLVDTLRAAGKAAVVVPLDCWLKGADQDRGRTVLDRYNIAGILAFLQNALVEPGVRRIARYDRVERRSIPDSVELDVPPQPVLVVEGVPALAYPELRALASQSFFVRRDEQARLAELTANYRWRGWDEARIAEMVESRSADELPVIEPTSQYANVILEESQL